MISPPTPHRRYPRRGSILLYTFIVLVVAGVLVVSLTRLARSNMGQVHRAEARLKAFYAAEAGVQQVVDWFNRGYYTWLRNNTALLERLNYTEETIARLHTFGDNLFPDPTFQAYFAPFSDGQFIDGNGNSSFSMTPLAIEPDNASHDTYADYLPEIADPETGDVLARIVQLTITRPPDGSEYLADVVCVGEHNTRARGTVRVRLQKGWVPAIISPAAIITTGGAGSNGQFEVYWGEVWAHQNLLITYPLDQKYADESEDPWFVGRSEAHCVARESNETNVSYADGLADRGKSATPIPQSSPNYYQPFNSLDPANVANFSGHQNQFYQHVTDLDWPDYNYRVMKSFFLRHDHPVYRTTADGKIIDQDGVAKDFYDIFNLSGTLDPDQIDPDEMPPLYFIDTTDGQPPRSDGSNTSTIKVSGNGPLFYGFYFIAPNLEMSGSGNSPTLDNPIRPDLSIGSSIRNCRIHGLFYTYSGASFQGEGDVFGSLYAAKGFTGGGNWEVYYDQRLSDPYRNRTESRVAFEIWDTE